MDKYKLTVGLEIHAELKTLTKMFCDSKNPAGKPAASNGAGDQPPNIDICPVCLGYPGTLPVVNKEAVRSILRIGTALGGEIADYTEFDRKNYFYPDIPKGYQISQYKYPLVKGGELLGVKITRVHLEEDTARSLHNFQFPISNFQSNPNESISNENSMKIAKLKTENSLLDFNRAGVPLMELVTEPVIKSADEAVNFARELQLLLKYLNVSGANMEKGEMRVEANISISKDDNKGTKVEVKNLNSFKVVEKAIKFEIARQAEILENGGKITQETRGWDEKREITFSQRLKESAHDYRYFPDPDLPSYFIKEIPEFDENVLRNALPELPWQKRERYLKEYKLKENDVEIYVREPQWGDLFEEVIEILISKNLGQKSDQDYNIIQLASNYITSDLKTPITARSLVEVLRMILSGEISSRGAKDILKIIQENGGEPRAIAEGKKLMQESRREVLKNIAEEVLSLETGKEQNINYLIGQAMKKSQGSANPVILREVFEELVGIA
ncbi:MAG: Asp-tRNA(Asn)/Glu-tRNA(Gln) amidotransferase subunit GatB [Candidatus Zambryskibacteria bacterium CG_4_9_14_3_um_filter_42_9]|nr:MAG: Asp-tRNA(Asn)/Glu-tRNA(Gln) amidotransferase subunit GatB [Candidatus Zambryskibacteria bacterium CG_4_9_14_3_um_filter_42_9]